MAPNSQLVRIGEFLFNRETGDIRSMDSENGTEATRLPPQPARLLGLLVERDGELVSREEIRQLLWADTHVDFESSLHFCVRQVRAALRESADAPTYIETLPKRGYRLMQPVERIEPQAETGEVRPGTDAPVSRRRLFWVGLLAVGVVFLIAALSRTAPAVVFPVRLAIMPFEFAGEGPEHDDLARISEWLVAEFSRTWPEQVHVLGPRSTHPYSSPPFPDLQALSRDLSVDFVLNARYLEKDGESQLLVELIRMSDLAHPWGELFADPSSWQEVGTTTREALVKIFGLPR